MVNPDSTLIPIGLLIAVLSLALFTVVNLLGAKWLSDSNILVIWKTAVLVLTIVVLIILTFHPGNFSRGRRLRAERHSRDFRRTSARAWCLRFRGSNRPPRWTKPRNPKKDVARAIIIAMFVGAAIYILLEVAFIGLDPGDIAHDWKNPVGAGSSVLTTSWPLPQERGSATVLLIDAVISPAGTGLVYVGTSARISYALGEDDALPGSLTKVSKRGVPFGSILLSFVVGMIALLPFPSWQSLVGLVTDATAIMYAFAPVSLGALVRQHAGREHPYRVPWPSILTPFGFVAANLIIYWSGFEAIWKLLTAILLGRIIFEIALRRSKSLQQRRDIDWRAASWIWPWLIGILVIGLLGRYGSGSLNVLPEWIDILFVVCLSLIMFYYAISLAMSPTILRPQWRKTNLNSGSIDLPLTPKVTGTSNPSDKG